MDFKTAFAKFLAAGPRKMTDEEMNLGFQGIEGDGYIADLNNSMLVLDVKDNEIVLEHIANGPSKIWVLRQR